MNDIDIEIHKFKSEEQQAKSWIECHPGWALAIGTLQFVIIGYLAYRAFI